ncbi:hypothetical protein M1555_00295 [Patescibacteria group bacterium]|nr:hypothetical protein [Patescibacteria group bacterium]
MNEYPINDPFPHHVDMDDVISPEQAVDWFIRIRAREFGIALEDWISADSVPIPEDAEPGDILGLVHCTCGRMHILTLRTDGERHVDTGWY